MAGPLGTRAQRHPFTRFLHRIVGRGGPRVGGPGVDSWLHMPPEPLTGVVWEVVLPVPWIMGRKWTPLRRVAGPWLGRWGGLRRHCPDITTQPQAPITNLGRRHRQKHQQPRAGGFLSRQKHVNRAGATELFSHSIPQRIIDQDVTQEVVFFSFSWKFESTLSPIIRHFRERKQRSPKGKNDPLAGKAGSRIQKTSLHQLVQLFFLGLKQALAWLTASV